MILLCGTSSTALRKALKAASTATVSGVALSPEYIYPIRTGELLPDDRRYCIIWMRRSELEASFDMKGAFNNATFSLLPGANASAVMKAIDSPLIISRTKPGK